MSQTDRLPLWRAAWVIARRDFLAILKSRAFLFFLLGPLFPVLVGGLAGGIGNEVRDQVDRPALGVAMAGADRAAVLRAHRVLAPQLGQSLPELVVVDPPADGSPLVPAQVLRDTSRNLGALLVGTLDDPRLHGPPDQIKAWEGRTALLLREARSDAANAPAPFPQVETVPTGTTNADRTRTRLLTAQGGQVLLFLLTMLLAGMVLSNLVEEKANKIIEILAAAIPMDAVFFGKLFAMLGISFVGIAVWGSVIGAILLASGQSLGAMAEPAVGWPFFVGLFILYFAMAYLLLGSVFLAIGSLATTVREVQTLSMPVTMLQLLVFFFASYTLAMRGSPAELAAIAIPFSSPFAMLARAAQVPDLWPHLGALAWQAMWVALFIKLGARMFRRRVMKSGGPSPARKSVWARMAAGLRKSRANSY